MVTSLCPLHNYPALSTLPEFKIILDEIYLVGITISLVHLKITFGAKLKFTFVAYTRLPFNYFDLSFTALLGTQSQ